MQSEVQGPSLQECLNLKKQTDVNNSYVTTYKNNSANRSQSNEEMCPQEQVVGGLWVQQAIPKFQGHEEVRFPNKIW